MQIVICTLETQGGSERRSDRSELAWPGQLTHGHILPWHRLWSLPLAGAPSRGHPPGMASLPPAGPRSGHRRGLSHPGPGRVEVSAVEQAPTFLALPTPSTALPARLPNLGRVTRSTHLLTQALPRHLRYWISLPSSTPYTSGFPGGQQKGHPCPQRRPPASLAPSDLCLGVSVTSPNSTQ